MTTSKKTPKRLQWLKLPEEWKQLFHDSVVDPEGMAFPRLRYYEAALRERVGRGQGPLDELIFLRRLIGEVGSALAAGSDPGFPDAETQRIRAYAKEILTSAYADACSTDPRRSAPAIDFLLGRGLSGLADPAVLTNDDACAILDAGPFTRHEVRWVKSRAEWVRLMRLAGRLPAVGDQFAQAYAAFKLRETTGDLTVGEHRYVHALITSALAPLTTRKPKPQACA